MGKLVAHSNEYQTMKMMTMIAMVALIFAGCPQQIMAKKTIDGGKQLEQRLRLLQPKGCLFIHI